MSLGNLGKATIGLGYDVEEADITIGATAGDGSYTFGSNIKAVLGVYMTSDPTNIADNYNLEFQVNKNEDSTGTASTGELTIDAYEVDMSATTPTWTDSTGTGITTDITMHVVVLLE